MRVEVQARASGAPSPRRVRSVLGRAARAAGARAAEVSVLFCADGRMRSLNRRYRRKDRSTDVLAFPAGPGAEGLLGDIVVSVPYATRQARRRRDRPEREIDRLLLHGLLHLMGFDHETDQGQMEALERRLRLRLGIAEASEKGRGR